MSPSGRSPANKAPQQAGSDAATRRTPAQPSRRDSEQDRHLTHAESTVDGMLFVPLRPGVRGAA
jgi:hypothetical protein